MFACNKGRRSMGTAVLSKAPSIRHVLHVSTCSGAVPARLDSVSRGRSGRRRRHHRRPSGACLHHHSNKTFSRLLSVKTFLFLLQHRLADHLSVLQQQRVPS